MFTIPFWHYEWNMMPFGQKIALFEFQNVMNGVFNPYTTFTIVYIDDPLMCSDSVDQHWKHLRVFLKIVKCVKLVVLAKKVV